MARLNLGAMALSLFVAIPSLLPLPAQAAWAVAGGTPYMVSISTEAPSAEQAKRNAMAHCRSTAGAFSSRCKILATGSGQCVGTAYNSDVPTAKKQWFVGVAQTEAAARKAAIAKCSSEAPGRCRTNHAFCEKL